MPRIPFWALLTCLTAIASLLATERLPAQTLRRRPRQLRSAPPQSADRTTERVSIEMQLSTDRALSPLKVQQWVQVLEPLAIRPLAIGQPDSGDKLDVSEERTAAGRHVVIQGRIDARGRLLVPDHAFTLGDRAGIMAWLDELKRFGPRGSPEGKPLWGLSEAEFRRLFDQLSVPLARSFNQTPLPEVLASCEQTTGVSIAGAPIALQPANPTGEPSITPSPPRPLAPSPSRSVAPAPARPPGGPLVTLPELGLSVGTSLAYVLSQHDLAFRVEPTRDGPPRLVVVPRAACPDPWPIGWPTPKLLSELAPKLMEFTPVELINAPADQVFRAVEEHAGVPFLYDRAALQRRAMDLKDVKVSFTSKSTFWKKVLDRAATEARLDAQLKTDEAGKPFVWISASASRSAPLRPRRSRPAAAAPKRDRQEKNQENSP